MKSSNEESYDKSPSGYEHFEILCVFTANTSHSKDKVSGFSSYAIHTASFGLHKSKVMTSAV
ncbi:hypothetical protein G9P44_003681 [Scheffersomyces stipitis]|nr:hypothetical protein G9P44_003681 [Scheffersomyces stipitis]